MDTDALIAALNSRRAELVAELSKIEAALPSVAARRTRGTPRPVRAAKRVPRSTSEMGRVFALVGPAGVTAKDIPGDTAHDRSVNLSIMSRRGLLEVRTDPATGYNRYFRSELASRLASNPTE